MATETEEVPGSGEDEVLTKIKKRLLVYRISTWLMIPVTLACLAAALYTIWDSGQRSFAAFEVLPVYQVNRLLVNYRNQSEKVEQHLAATQDTLHGAQVTSVYAWSGAIPELMLAGEEQWQQDLQDYRLTVAELAGEISGTREWFQYFQRDLLELEELSRKRQETINGILLNYPGPPPEETSEAELEP